MDQDRKQLLVDLAIKAVERGIKAWLEGRRLAKADGRISKRERTQIRVRVLEAILGALLEAAGLSESWLGEQIDRVLGKLAGD